MYDEKAVAKSLQKPGATELLAKYCGQLAAAEPFEAQPLEQMTHAFVEAQGVKIGDIVHALRAAVTGQRSAWGCSTAWRSRQGELPGESSGR